MLISKLLLQLQQLQVSLILLVGINHTIMVHQNTKKLNRIYFQKRKLNTNFGSQFRYNYDSIAGRIGYNRA